MATPPRRSAPRDDDAFDARHRDARATVSPPASVYRTRDASFDVDAGGGRSVSARATPNARDRARESGRGHAGGDGTASRLNFDDDAVRGALDRLAFANSLNQVADALGEVMQDASEEVGSYASAAKETLMRFQAAQHAAQWNPIESGLTMRPTYVKVPVSSVEQLKFWESDDVRGMKMLHLQEKQAILAENAGMRALLGEEASETVQELRETEDGVNRALLLAAVEEITNLKTRISVLEGEAARQKVSASGYGGLFGGGGPSGVDQAQMQKLTRELASLEEKNSRMTWMLGEKEKQIKEVRAKYTESAAYVLQEKLQECMEALEVACNLQGEQLQYLEQHALSKLEALEDQVCDIQLAAESKAEHLAQLRTIMKRFFVDGDEGSVDVLTSLTGFSPNEGRKLVEARQSRSLTGFLSMVATKLTPAVNAASSMIVACAPPTSNAASANEALKTLGVEEENEDTAKEEKSAATPAEATSDEKSASVQDGDAKEEAPAMESKPQQPERRRATRAPKKKTTAFAGFDDPALEEKKQAERAKTRQPLPQPKLVGKAAERERAKREAAPRDVQGFAGFGDDPDASSSDES